MNLWKKLSGVGIEIGMVINMSRLVLIRGLPGSGKSTLAKSLTTDGFLHFETDMFWGPDYKFDISRIREAHQWCQDSVKYAFANGAKKVVVSNTFTTKKELQPYFDIVKDMNILPHVILCQNNFGNIHNVPQEALTRMNDRFEYDISELFGVKE